VVWTLCLVVVPIFLLAAAELALRAAGVAAPEPFFLELSAGEYDILQTNPRFYDQYVNVGEISRDKNRLTTLLREKPEGTVRVVALGGSAAMGWPDASTAFDRFLDMMCREALPDRRVEIINFASSGVDSGVLVEISEAIRRQLQPDVWVLYSGNNELSGPNNPSLVKPAFSWLDELRLARAIRALRPNSAPESRPTRNPPASTVMMAREALTREAADAHSEHLREILSAAEKAGDAALVATVPVNKREWPPAYFAPFGAQGNDDGWRATVDEIQEMQARGEHDAAMRRIESLEDADDFACTVYFQGVHLWAGQRGEEAMPLFERAIAMDEDVYVRVKPVVNDAIRSAGADFNGARMALVDCDKVFDALAEAGVSDRELFVDSCHLSHRGAYEFARAVWPEFCRLVSGKDLDVPLEYKDCIERLAPERGAEYSARKSLLDHGTMLQGLIPRPLAMYAQLEAERARVDAAPEIERCEQLARAYRLAGPDYVNGEAYIKCLLDSDPERALEVAAEHLRRYGQNPEYQQRYAQALQGLGRHEEAAAHVELAQRLREVIPSLL